MTKAKKLPIGENVHTDRYKIVNQILALTHPRFDGKKFVKGMSVLNAAQEAGITSMTLSRWLKEDDILNSLWLDAREGQKASMIAKAMENVENALYGEIKLRPSELINVSLRFLEKTSDDFKDKIEVGGKIETEVTASLDDLIHKASELAAKLK